MPQTTNSITPNKLTVPDLISVGVFTALYFVLVTVATFTCALLPGVGNIVLPALAALISGSVYMLLAAKLQKFGGITIMGLVMGLFFFVSGHFVLSFAANIVCGLLADLIAARGKFRSEKLLLVSYVVFSYGLTGPILPLWFMKDAYIANLTARGKDAAYIDTLFAPINNGSFVAAMAAILVCAALGGQICWHGRPANEKQRLHNSFLVMQDVNYQLFSDSVQEEILLGAAHPERCDEVMQALRLAGLADRHPMSLSGGQKQRVVVAAAMLSDKPLILLDEPTSGLDWGSMQQVGRLMQVLKAQGKTLLVITHDEELAAAWCDRVITLS